MVFNKTLTVLTHDGSNHNFDDVGVKGAATTAYNQYMAHQTIHSHIQKNGEYVEVFIPYSSIMDVFIGEVKNNLPIWDKNCSEGSCEGLYFFYSTSPPTLSPLGDATEINVNVENGLFVMCANDPDFSGDPSQLVPMTVEASDPSLVNIVEEGGIYSIFPISSSTETEITLSVPSQGCVRKFTIKFVG